MGSQGNGLISRSIIYGVTEALKIHAPEDILVGVMWSGSNRHDYRCFNTDELSFVQNKIHNGWIENPTGFVKDSVKNWVILNVNWSDTENVEARTHYRMFHDHIGSSIYSLEHVLRTQWFLQSMKINYFFTDYIDENIVSDYNKTHPEISHLYNLLDKNHYLPVSSEHNWIVNNSKYIHLWGDDWKKSPCHPKTEMHKEFVDQVIMPWLTENDFIVA